MKRLLTLIMLLPLMGMAQESSDKPKKEKPKHFELWASVGMGNTVFPNSSNLSPGRYYYRGLPYFFSSKSYLPKTAIHVGVGIGSRVHAGVRIATQTMSYVYDDTKNSKKHTHNELMTNLGVYCKYTHPIGRLSPYVSVNVSRIHSQINLPKPFHHAEVTVNHMGYGVALGAQYQLIKALKATAQIEAVGMSLDSEDYFYQKGASVGILFSF